MGTLSIAAGVFDRGFGLIPDPVNITIVPSIATLGGLLGGLVSALLDRQHMPSARASLNGALAGAAAATLFLVIGLLGYA